MVTQTQLMTTILQKPLLLQSQWKWLTPCSCGSVVWRGAALDRSFLLIDWFYVRTAAFDGNFRMRIDFWSKLQLHYQGSCDWFAATYLIIYTWMSDPRHHWFNNILSFPRRNLWVKLNSFWCLVGRCSINSLSSTRSAKRLRVQRWWNRYWGLFRMQRCRVRLGSHMRALRAARRCTHRDIC